MPPEMHNIPIADLIGTEVDKFLDTEPKKN